MAAYKQTNKIWHHTNKRTKILRCNNNNNNDNTDNNNDNKTIIIIA